jgi:hypothetical protein
MRYFLIEKSPKLCTRLSGGGDFARFRATLSPQLRTQNLGDKRFLTQIFDTLGTEQL